MVEEGEGELKGRRNKRRNQGWVAEWVKGHVRRRNGRKVEGGKSGRRN